MNEPLVIVCEKCNKPVLREHVRGGECLWCLGGRSGMITNQNVPMHGGSRKDLGSSTDNRFHGQRSTGEW